MIPDIVEIKRLCASGQWFAKIENGRILLHDTIAGETVCIGQADAEPVRHGKWRIINVPKKWGGSTLRCSECNTGSTYLWNYCPNCGAKMDLKDDAQCTP
jgi:hypothetical protein